jgi:hypothetical protein
VKAVREAEAHPKERPFDPSKLEKVPPILPQAMIIGRTSWHEPLLDGNACGARRLDIADRDVPSSSDRAGGSARSLCPGRAAVERLPSNQSHCNLQERELGLVPGSFLLEAEQPRRRVG